MLWVGHYCMRDSLEYILNFSFKMKTTINCFNKKSHSLSERMDVDTKGDMRDGTPP